MAVNLMEGRVLVSGVAAEYSMARHALFVTGEDVR